ncbi:MAG: hypothetical protein F6J96_24580 [Symploca sp. SIO1C2]|nr:hypothetical protein [Symploca sp. SIO1C2]
MLLSLTLFSVGKGRGGERKKVWGCEELRELGELRKLRELRKLGDKRELIAIGYKAQEIPPKISFTRDAETRREGFSCMVVKKFFIGTASCLLPPAFCLLLSTKKPPSQLSVGVYL